MTQLGQVVLYLVPHLCSEAGRVPPRPQVYCFPSTVVTVNDATPEVLEVPMGVTDTPVMGEANTRGSATTPMYEVVVQSCWRWVVEPPVAVVARPRTCPVARET